MKAVPVKDSPDGYVKCAPSEATHVLIRLPGPQGLLTLPVGGTGWNWNRDTERPTLTPSVLCTKGPNQPEFRCHSYITDGKAQFLGDCHHELRGQTHDLLEVGLSQYE